MHRALSIHGVSTVLLNLSEATLSTRTSRTNGHPLTILSLDSQMGSAMYRSLPLYSFGHGVFPILLSSLTVLNSQLSREKSTFEKPGSRSKNGHLNHVFETSSARQELGYLLGFENSHMHCVSFRRKNTITADLVPR
ncbi:hypothetical protein BXZ70DRAFT_125947 [Cristinia sonorae]|uniref:Uncharacterized protein n=1 Tax=Cristinia sonorae TaxID=1940300 RepID=A0A8K0UR19_9AGAR|nr:hypothetical protein BXZ70DRAFT_125947 [Cristinia sonorae]